jgi:hypothetical protein
MPKLRLDEGTVKRTGCHIRTRILTSLVILTLYAVSCIALPASFTFNMVSSAQAAGHAAAETGECCCCCCKAAPGTPHQCSCCRTGGCHCRISEEEEFAFPILILRAGDLLAAGVLIRDAASRQDPIIPFQIPADPDLFIPTPPPKTPYLL